MFDKASSVGTLMECDGLKSISSQRPLGWRAVTSFFDVGTGSGSMTIQLKDFQ